MTDHLTRKMTGIESIAAERQRQIEAEGWTAEHDDKHTEGELAHAAAEYAWHAGVSEGGRAEFPPGAPSELWPWASKWWKPKSRREDLVRAGALIAAEIDRLDRAALKEPSHD